MIFPFVSIATVPFSALALVALKSIVPSISEIFPIIWASSSITVVSVIVIIGASFTDFISKVTVAISRASLLSAIV